MSLTPGQLTTFKTDIVTNTNQLIINALVIGNNNGIVDWYNLDASPAFTVWINSMSISTLQETIDWSEVVGLGTNGLLAFQVLVSQVDGFVNPSKSTIRNAFQQIFSGPNNVNSRTALDAAAKRFSSNIEKLFATGTGTDGDPAVMGFEGSVLRQDVRDAIALP